MNIGILRNKIPTLLAQVGIVLIGAVSALIMPWQAAVAGAIVLALLSVFCGRRFRESFVPLLLGLVHGALHQYFPDALVLGLAVLQLAAPVLLAVAFVACLILEGWRWCFSRARSSPNSPAGSGPVA
jgi:hypothetical protein